MTVRVSDRALVDDVAIHYCDLQEVEKELPPPFLCLAHGRVKYCQLISYSTPFMYLLTAAGLLTAAPRGVVREIGFAEQPLTIISGFFF